MNRKLTIHEPTKSDPYWTVEYEDDYNYLPATGLTFPAALKDLAQIICEIRQYDKTLNKKKFTPLGWKAAENIEYLTSRKRRKER